MCENLKIWKADACAMPTLASMQVVGQAPAGILPPDAQEFLVELEQRFGPRRRELLAARAERQAAFDAGAKPGLLPETAHVRDDDWTVAPIPAPLQDRRVEITGPVDAKMMINALNSGAKVFMADFEDSLSPTWANAIAGQENVRAAVRGELTFDHPTKGTYRIGDDPAVLVLRPRGWHLEERHVLVEGRPMSASLFDFGLAFWHNAKEQVARGVGPYYYLPKLEHHDEARLWDDVFRFAQERVGLPLGTIKATVLIETLPAAFQMDEILWALRDHAAGLNAGRWDYIFSTIKTLRHHPEHVLPDRSAVTMAVPHMQAYTDRLIATCHRRGAFAMGGMSAFIPDRRDPARTEEALRQVRVDKRREAEAGCDGTWVAHPDLVPVAMEAFDAVLQGAPNQVGRTGEAAPSEGLLDTAAAGGAVTIEGVRTNADVALRYLAAWLDGQGAVAIHGLMEDAATAEISRSQLTQWIRHGVVLDDGTKATLPLVEGLLASMVDERTAEAPHLRWDDAGRLLVAAVRDDPAFLTLSAYDALEDP